MRLILVRHAETEDNAKHILAGHRHGKLSKKGRMQARRLALRLSKEKIDIIFSSDLGRAKDTTKTIAGYHGKIPIIYTKLLREQNYGILQDKKWSKVISMKKPLGGESLYGVRARVKLFLNKLTRNKKLEGKTVLISAHTGVAWSMLSILAHAPMRKVVKLRPKNAGMLVFEVSNKGSVVAEDGMFD